MTKNVKGAISTVDGIASKIFELDALSARL